jgi:hypothetical protein
MIHNTRFDNKNGMNINLIDTYNETCMIQINMVYYSMTINVYWLSQNVDTIHTIK